VSACDHGLGKAGFGFFWRVGQIEVLPVHPATGDTKEQQFRLVIFRKENFGSDMRRFAKIRDVGDINIDAVAYQVGIPSLLCAGAM
jgi:hypothetical protein